jgi:hypothetical protein
MRRYLNSVAIEKQSIHVDPDFTESAACCPLNVRKSYNRRNTLRISKAGGSVAFPFAERNKATVW